MVNSFKSSVVLAYLRYLKWKFFPSQAQLADKKYHLSRLQFYSQFLRAGDLCFDVGANFGNRTEIFLKLNADVVAIEPQPACYKMLNVKFGNKITIIKKALGAKVSEGIMHLSNSYELSSLSDSWINAVSNTRFKETKWESDLKIQIDTLDNLISRFGVPKFCKIDVEGYEEEVLLGLSKRIPFISFEYTVPERLNSVRNCFNQLEKIGKFECNFTVGESMELKLDSWTSSIKVLDILNQMNDDNYFGDIYVRFEQPAELN